MSDELRAMDEEFDTQFLKIKKGMDSLKKADMVAWGKLDKNLKELEDQLASYKLEIYELDKGQRTNFERVLLFVYYVFTDIFSPLHVESRAI